MVNWLGEVASIAREFSHETRISQAFGSKMKRRPGKRTDQRNSLARVALKLLQVHGTNARFKMRAGTKTISSTEPPQLGPEHTQSITRLGAHEDSCHVNEASAQNFPTPIRKLCASRALGVRELPRLDQGS